MHVRDKAEIKRLFEEIAPSVVHSSSVPAYLALLTDDIIWCPPNAIDRHGLEDVAVGYSAMLATQSFDPTFTVEEINVYKSSSGYVLGTGSIIVQPKDGSPSTLAHSTELWLLRKERGKWKMARMVWNLKPAEQSE